MFLFFYIEDREKYNDKAQKLRNNQYVQIANTRWTPLKTSQNKNAKNKINKILDI